jgi:hypothetical protein
MHRSKILFTLIGFLSAGAVACGDDDDTPRDAGDFVTDFGVPPEDSGVTPDMGPPDMGFRDLGMADMGEADMGEADMGEADMGEADMGEADMGEADMGEADAGPVDMGGADAGPVDLGGADMGTPDGGMMSPNTGMQIAAVRAQAVMANDTAVSPALPIRSAVVTYVLPAGVNDAGYFVQAGPTGPAIFINSGSTAPTVSVGDVVDLDVTRVNDNNDFLEVTGVMNVMTVRTGANVNALIQDVSTATDTVANVRAYESERIRITGTLADTGGFAGSGYRAYQMDTAGVMNDRDLRFRLPDGVDTQLAPSQGCQLTASGAMWRFRSDAQPQVWRTADISNVSCPLSASAMSATSVVIDFGRSVDASSVNMNGGQFTISGLTVSAASVSGTQVTLTTSMQTSGTSYTVQVASTVQDVTGSGISAPNNSATFSGYVMRNTPTAAGDVVITEIMKNPDAVSDGDGEWFELYNPGGQMLDLTGCVISDDGSDTHTLGTLSIGAGAYIALARSSMPGFTPDYEYSSYSLANGADEVILTCGMTVIDRVDYDDNNFPDDTGRSMQLDSSAVGGMNPATANDSGSNWCSGTNDYNMGDQGTPGAANASCP